MLAAARGVSEAPLLQVFLHQKLLEPNWGECSIMAHTGACHKTHQEAAEVTFLNGHYHSNVMEHMVREKLLVIQQ
jgi:hypothetical protein